MTRRANLYLGKAGQMYVMAEFLERGWNVGAPEVDVGDDIFVVRDIDGDLSRIQVKTARAQLHSYGYSAQYNVRATQLAALREPPLDYFFVVRTDDVWGPFVVIRQGELQRLAVTEAMGSRTSSSHIFRFRYFEDDGEITRIDCSGRDLTSHINDFSTWERIEH